MFLHALRSLWNRRFVAALTALSIALSVALILGVERLRAEARQLALLAECLGAMQRGGLDVQGLFRKTRFLSKSLFACPRG